MSTEARFYCGLTLVLVPTIVYGGLTVLGALSGGRYGAPAPPGLTAQQVTFYRAGHAHAGVLALLALFIQMAIDQASLPLSLVTPLRIAALAAPILVSGGFFGLAHFPPLRALLYLGAATLAVTTLTVGVGLMKAGR